MTGTLGHLQKSLEGYYAIERELGHGGMATVYLARDLKHGRYVAIKVPALTTAALQPSDASPGAIEAPTTWNIDTSGEAAARLADYRDAG